MRRIAVLVVLLAGCSLYPEIDPHHGDPQPDACVFNAPPAIELRDPQTGVCQPIGGGGCPDPCLPCAGGGGSGGALPDWAECNGRCEALDEPTCMATAECRAVYRNDHTGTRPQFFGCWGTAHTFTSTGTCTGLDAWTCSQHDNCGAIYDAGSNGPDAFASCITEPKHDPGLCQSATCNSAPPKCAVGSTAGVANGCYTGYCIPTGQCGKHDAGSCDLATCASASPACPTGTIPGTSNGCYTGFCIPLTACP